MSEEILWLDKVMNRISELEKIYDQLSNWSVGIDKQIAELRDAMKIAGTSISETHLELNELKEEVETLGDVEEGQWAEMFTLKEFLREFGDLYKEMIMCFMGIEKLTKTVDLSVFATWSEKMRGLLEKLDGKKEKNRYPFCDGCDTIYSKKEDGSVTCDARCKDSGDEESVKKGIGDDSFVDKPEPIRLSSNGRVLDANEGMPSTDSNPPEPKNIIEVICANCGEITLIVLDDIKEKWEEKR